MKTRIFPIILALLMVNGVAVASDNNGLYLKGGLAYTMPVDATTKGTNFGASLDKDIGYSLGVGYDFGEMFRIEGEYLTQKNDADNFNDGNAAVGATNSNITYTAFLVNGIVDYMVADSIGIYGVAGIGWGEVETSLYGQANDDTGLAWKVGFGTFYDITENWAVDLGYEYLKFDDVDFFDGTTLENLASHNIIGAVRYTF
jgi:opacity protein-like surface antigen